MTGKNDATEIRQLIDRSRASGDPTGWFDTLYAAAAAGSVTVPWDRHAPHPVLVEWARRRQPDGTGKRAVIVGCGTGDDAAMVAALGFETTAFDISASAIEAAQHRYPDSGVHFGTANLLDPPPDWLAAFDLVVESQTVQALPLSLREQAIAAVAHLVAPGGTLIVQAAATDDQLPSREGPPWPLTRREIDRFATHRLEAVETIRSSSPAGPAASSWCAEFHRPPGHERHALPGSQETVDVDVTDSSPHKRRRSR